MQAIHISSRRVVHDSALRSPAGQPRLPAAFGPTSANSLPDDTFNAKSMRRPWFGLEAAQVVLGHSAADVTQIYAERDMAKAAEVMKQVG